MTLAVLFDMDGVLVDSEAVINAAAIQALADYGVSARPEEFLPFVGAGEDRYVGGVAERHGLTYRVEMKQRTYEHYFRLLPAMGHPFPGVAGLLARLRRAGVALAVASSADRRKVVANLALLGVPAEWFAATVTGDDITRKKPAPDLYLEAARRVGVAPGGCCVVEDALNGVEAARAAGMRCVAVATSFPPERLAAAGAAVVRSSPAALTLADLGVAAEEGA
ncbi:MAG: HAD-IA family hydrolase [Lentisphaeria bacterium]|jgi:HAD superfamily hydrolase (TIGR01509 family)